MMHIMKAYTSQGFSKASQGSCQTKCIEGIAIKGIVFKMVSKGFQKVFQSPSNDLDKRMLLEGLHRPSMGFQTTFQRTFSDTIYRPLNNLRKVVALPFKMLP